MVSICIIAKNEEENIERCLSSIGPYDFEIVVVDTGSTDRTKEIALQYTHCVFDYEWKDDFSDARNYAIEQATRDYIFMLDCDEYITSLDYEKLIDLLKTNSKDVGRISRINTFIRNGEQTRIKEPVNRIFNKHFFKYQGRIHEQIVKKDGSKYGTYNIPVVLEHTGYDGDVAFIKEKTERNIFLLLKDLEEIGEDPYILYQLGKSYYMQGDYIEACTYFSKALEYDLNPQAEFVIDLVETYGYALLNCQEYRQALQFENIYQEFGNRPEFKFLMGLIYMNNGEFNQAIKEFYKATKYDYADTQGINTYKAYYNIGVIYQCLGDKKNATMYYKKCGDYPMAKKMLDELER